MMEGKSRAKGETAIKVKSVDAFQKFGKTLDQDDEDSDTQSNSELIGSIMNEHPSQEPNAVICKNKESENAISKIELPPVSP